MSQLPLPLPPASAPLEKLQKMAAPFRKCLTIEEEAEVQVVAFDRKRLIVWGKLTRTALSVLFAMIRPGLLRSTKLGAEWIRFLPGAELTPNERKFLFHSGRGKLRQQFLLLLVVKKLLGALKTHVNQLLAETQSQIALAENACFNQIENSLGYGTIDDQEMIDVIDSILRGEYPTNPRERASCQHKLIHYRRPDPYLEEQVCGECNTLLATSFVPQTSQREHEEAYWARLLGGLTRKRPHQCSGVWVAGKEGKEAYCPGCKKPIANPETFLWARVGLEPFGDDPSQDRLITLDPDEAEDV